METLHPQEQATKLRSLDTGGRAVPLREGAALSTLPSTCQLEGPAGPDQVGQEVEPESFGPSPILCQGCSLPQWSSTGLVEEHRPFATG